MPAQMTINSKPLLDKLKAMSDKRHIQVVNQALREGAKVFQAAVIEEAPERVDGYRHAAPYGQSNGGSVAGVPGRPAWFAEFVPTWLWGWIRHRNVTSR